MNSPTQRSLSLLRSRGYLVDVVEHWNAFARRRVDLFGVADLVAIKPGEILLVQTTSYSNLWARREKISTHENWLAIRTAGFAFHLHGWKSQAQGKRRIWSCKEEILCDPDPRTYAFERQPVVEPLPTSGGTLQGSYTESPKT